MSATAQRAAAGGGGRLTLLYSVTSIVIFIFSVLLYSICFRLVYFVAALVKICSIFSRCRNLELVSKHLPAPMSKLRVLQYVCV